jgi:hypothetical protein
VYWSGKKGREFDIGSVILEDIAISAAQGIATGIQLGPGIRVRSFELRGGLISASKIGVQIGPNTSVTGVIAIKNSVIRAGEIGVQVGPGTQVAEYLEISRNSIEAGVIGIQIGPPGMLQEAPPSIGTLVITRNRIASTSSKVLEIKSIVRDHAYIYLNTFLGDGTKALLSLDPGLVPIDKITFNTPDKVTYFYRGKAFTNYLGNYYIDWTKPDNDVDGIVDVPRTIPANYSDSYPIADPTIIQSLEQPWTSGLSGEEVRGETRGAMGGGVVDDAASRGCILLITLATLLLTSIEILFKAINCFHRGSFLKALHPWVW